MKRSFFRNRSAARSIPRPRITTVLQLEQMEDRCLLSSAAAGYGQLPLAFEPNVGESLAGIDYLAQGPGYSVGLTGSTALLSLQNGLLSTEQFIDVLLLGADPAAKAIGQQQLPGVVNHLLGSSPSDWHTNIPTYAQVSYQNVYPGVDLVYHGSQGQLEYDFVVNPAASPGLIRLSIGGVQSLSLDAPGDLVLHTSGGVLTEKAPSVYQTANDINRPVAGRYVLENGNQVGFAVGSYDATKPLVIDPVLQYSTYLGGSGGELSGGIAVDSVGAVYVSGETISTDFPTAGNPFMRSMPNGVRDAFVSKLNGDGSALLYSTYLGGTISAGSPVSDSTDIAIDGSGDAFVFGNTDTTDFPTAGSLQHDYSHGDGGVFVAELNPTGSGLIYSTLLGGTNSNSSFGMARDASGNVYITGQTGSTDFPTLNAFEPSYPAGSLLTGFVSKLNTNGQLAYSSYLGGNNLDQPEDIAVDSSGDAYVAGNTQSTNFPTAGAPLQRNLQGQQNAFVSEISPAGASLVYSTYLGGSGTRDSGNGITLDSAGNAYVAGVTDSTDFPTAGTPFQSSLRGADSNAFVSKLSPTGSSLIYSTYLGGTAFTAATGHVALDSAGDLYVSGDTAASDFPTAGNAPQRLYAGDGDAFVSELNPQGSGLILSTFLGGSGPDNGGSLTLGGNGDVYVVGASGSSNFPVNPGVVQTQERAKLGIATFFPQNLFIAKLAPLSWQVSGLTLASDNLPRVLWSGADWADLWQFDSSLKSAAQPVLGPVSGGWSAVTEAAGSDGLARLLWSNAVTGQTALWIFNSSNVQQAAHVFSPMTGWTPIDMAIDSSDNVRVLWTNGSGQAMISSINSSTFAVTTGTVFGPVSGWTPLKLAAGGDGLLRLLWDNADGQTSLWLMNADGSLHSAAEFGPIPGWTAADIAVDSSNQTRLLWSNPLGQAAIWSINDSLAVTATRGFGTFAGFTPTTIECAANGNEFLLWSNASGNDVLWQLGSDNAFQQAAFFGPVVIS